MNKDINNFVLIQKSKIENINKKLNILLESLNTKKSESFTEKFIYNLDNLRNSINNLEDVITDLQYNSDINDIDIDDKIKKRINEYEKNREIVNKFAPYILYLQILNQ